MQIFSRFSSSQRQTDGVDANSVRGPSRSGSGQTTSGGAICMRALCTGDGPDAWQPDLCVSAVVNTAIIHM